MVQEKSFVLPLTATFQSDNDSVLSLAEKADLISGSRSNRPYFNNSWIDKDHYKKPVEINQYEASVFDLSTMNHDVNHGRPWQSRTMSSMHLRS